MMIRRRGPLATLVVVLCLATGCAGGSAGPTAVGGSASAAASSAPVTAPSVAPSVGGSRPPVVSQPGAPGTAEPGPSKPSGTDPTVPEPPTTQVSGTVSAGVEPNCLVLTAGSTAYLLIISDPAAYAAAKVGATVTVSGHADPGLATTCQQGTPFVVTDVRPK